MGPKQYKSNAPRQTARDQYMQNLQAQSNLNAQYEQAKKRQDGVRNHYAGLMHASNGEIVVHHLVTLQMVVFLLTNLHGNKKLDFKQNNYNID